MAEKILYSGRAYGKFKQIVADQEGNFNNLKLAKIKKDIHVKKSGKIVGIDNRKINEMARIAGSPVDKGAGLYLYSHVGDKVKAKDRIITIYSETPGRLNEAIRFFHKKKPVRIA